MAIKKEDVQNVSQSAGFGFDDKTGVRRWMESKGYRTYADYAKDNAGRRHAVIQAEIEAFVFS